MNKNLKEKAIKLKGKDYVLVSDRVLFFNEEYPNGSITTEILPQGGDNVWVIRATVIPDSNTPERKFVGHSQAVIGEGYINKTSALENCETSAVGRALGMMGIGVIESIASIDEINKANNTEKTLNTLGNCKKCGAKLLMSKDGNPYCSDRCWQRPELVGRHIPKTEVPPLGF